MAESPPHASQTNLVAVLVLDEVELRGREWIDLRDADGRLHARLDVTTGTLVIRERRKVCAWSLKAALQGAAAGCASHGSGSDVKAVNVHATHKRSAHTGLEPVLII